MAWAISGRQRAIGLARPVGLRRFQATGLEAVATGLLLRLGIAWPLASTMASPQNAAAALLS